MRWWAGLLATAGAFLVVGGAWLAQAQDPYCAPRDQVKERLLRFYGEVSAGRGQSGGGRVVEIMVAPDTRTWTLIVNMGPNRACPALSGHNWQWPVGHGERKAWSR